MLRLLLLSLLLLLLLYAAKVALLQLAVPMESALGAEAEEGAPAEEGGRANASGLRAGLAAYRQGEDARALALVSACAEGASEASGASGAPGAPEAPEAGAARAACRTALAELLLVGAGAPRNLSEARRLLQLSADAGDAEAQFDLGVLYAAQVPGAGGGAAAAAELRRREALAVLHLYAASTAGHPGALMAMGYRHMHGYGVPQACTTAALNYIDVAKRIAGVYSEGMPQAVELVRLNLHQKDRKVISSSEMNLFVQIATSGDTTVAAAIGKRYLLGLEGFRQDYHKAKHYLRLAASRNHPGALALLGYMHCLGLGTPQNLDTAYSYFMSAAAQNDPLGHNGLGFIYFRGTGAQARNLRLAFRHFNESAYGGSSDGMFNLASMYLTGTGTEQSFQRAVLYYTQALDRGHTPAAYSLAVMHLNGIGTVRDCNIAVDEGAEEGSLYDSPALRKLFSKFVNAIGCTVAGLHDFGRLVPMLTQLGGRHANYGLNEGHWPILGKALMFTLRDCLGEEFTGEVEAAWSMVYGFMSNIMIEGLRGAQAQKLRKDGGGSSVDDDCRSEDDSLTTGLPSECDGNGKDSWTRQNSALTEVNEDEEPSPEVPPEVQG